MVSSSLVRTPPARNSWSLPCPSSARDKLFFLFFIFFFPPLPPLPPSQDPCGVRRSDAQGFWCLGEGQTVKRLFLFSAGPFTLGPPTFFFFFFFSLSLPFSDPSAKAEILAAHARRGERNNGAWKSLGDRRSWLGQGNVITFVNEGPFFPFPPKGAAFVPTFRNDSFLCFLLVLFFFFWFAGSTLARRTDPSARP